MFKKLIWINIASLLLINLPTNAGNKPSCCNFNETEDVYNNGPLIVIEPEPMLTPDIFRHIGGFLNPTNTTGMQSNI